MKSKTPLSNQISWVGFIPFHLLLFGSIYLFEVLGFDSLTGVVFSLALYFLLRYTISSSHRSGIRKMKKGIYEEAIADFESSYAFFKKHNWLDKYRCIFLLSPSAITYTEMALVNIAFAYSQLGDGKSSVKYYEQALKGNPNSILEKLPQNNFSNNPIQPVAYRSG